MKRQRSTAVHIIQAVVGDVYRVAVHSRRRHHAVTRTFDTTYLEHVGEVGAKHHAQPKIQLLLAIVVQMQLLIEGILAESLPALQNDGVTSQNDFAVAPLVAV